MATVTAIKVVPHTRIDNSIIANMADIGVYCYAVFSAIKMHLNQTNGDCFPSYARIARMTGIHRSTVIECVKKLRAFKLLSPQWRFKEDGSHASNQFNFDAPEKPGAAQGQETETAVPSKQVGTPIQTIEGSRPERPPLVAKDDHPGRPERPEQSPSLNKTKRTSPGALLPAEKPPAPVPTDKQQTCAHPPEDIGVVEGNIRICHHCWGLLDENLTLITGRSVESDAPDTMASAECDPPAGGEPEPEQPPAGKILAITDTQTPVEVAHKSPQMARAGGKTTGLRRKVVSLGKRILGARRAS